MNNLLSCLSEHPGLATLEASLPHIRQAPQASGDIKLLVCRPRTNQREVLQSASLHTETGMAGDNWLDRGYRQQPGGLAHPDMQLNLMNVRVIAAIAPSPADWPMAGDQIYVDLDLSASNLPPGTRLQIGSAVIEVTSEPHLGCRKFSERFGAAAVKFVNCAVGRQLNLRGINARIIQNGEVKVGDTIQKLP